MKGQIIKDWSKINIHDPADQALFRGALRHFLMAPHNHSLKNPGALSAMVQEMTLATDFPTSKLYESIKQFQQLTYYDTGYEEIFDMIDFSGDKKANGFDIDDIYDGLTFRLTVPGDKARVYAMHGERQRVFFQYYSGGLTWHKDAFEEGDWWNIEKKAKSFRNKAYSSKAASFYALIEALPVGRNLAWQLPDPATLPNTDPAYTAKRDAASFDAAALDIFTLCANKGYDLSPQSEFTVLTPIALWGRAANALNVNLQAFSGSPPTVKYRFKLIPTASLTSNDYFYVSLPKEKTIGGTRLDLTLFEDFDIYSLAMATVGWMRYVGVIADTEQHVRCLTA